MGSRGLTALYKDVLWAAGEGICTHADVVWLILEVVEEAAAHGA